MSKITIFYNSTNDTINIHSECKRGNNLYISTEDMQCIGQGRPISDLVHNNNIPSIVALTDDEVGVILDYIKETLQRRHK